MRLPINYLPLFGSAMRNLQAKCISNMNFDLLDTIGLYYMLFNPYYSTMTYLPLMLQMRTVRPRGGLQLGPAHRANEWVTGMLHRPPSSRAWACHFAATRALCVHLACYHIPLLRIPHSLLPLNDVLSVFIHFMCALTSKAASPDPSWKKTHKSSVNQQANKA